MSSLCEVGLVDGRTVAAVLHDSVAQSLAAARLGAERALRGDSGAAEETLTAVVDAATALRRVMTGLRTGRALEGTTR